MAIRLGRRITEFLNRNQFRLRRLAAYLRGLFYGYIVLTFYVFTGLPLSDVSRFQRIVLLRFKHEYSQNGEDGIIEAIFRKIGTTNRYYAEFGGEDGLQCNTRYLMKKHGWQGVLFDGKPPAGSSVHQEFITAENIQDIFRKYKVPQNLDLLSVDIDGNDYWVWKAITDYHPRVVVIEYNSMIPASEKKTIPYNPQFVWDGTDYYGASLGALESLGRQKGYRLIGTDRHGVNAFFVRAGLCEGNFIQRRFAELFHPPAFKGVAGRRHLSDTKARPWTIVA